MSQRIYLIPRKGDGLTLETAFQPDAVIQTLSWQYTVGTKFLVSSEDDLTAFGKEFTSPSAVKAACAIYGITEDHLGFTDDGTPVPMYAAFSQHLTLAFHAPVALVQHLWQRVTA